MDTIMKEQKSLSPFDFINAISYSKQNLMGDEANEKTYNPFMVNRGLSMYMDTIFAANEMNMNYALEKKLQFTFLINNIRPMKRWSKWAKKVNNDDLEMVKEYYGFSTEKAEFALILLSNEQKIKIKEEMETGGR